MFRFEALSKILKYLAFCLREAKEYDNFKHLKHANKE